jgi:hypothetical protein
MTTKRSKTTPARKSAKKSTAKVPTKKAPRKPAAKAAPKEVPGDTSPEMVEYVFRGTTYQLQKDDAGYHFGELTFKSMAGFGKHMAKLNGAPDAATETDALLDHVETTLAKPRAAKRDRKALPVPKEMRAPSNPRVAPGATLTRTYKGNEITVKVQDDGTFLYEGQTFRSISAVAKHIVGYMISGPVFFRLVEPNAAAEAE